jgi:hypothetical protein
VEILGGQSFSLGIHSPGPVSVANPGDGGRAVRNGAARPSGAGGDEIHPRLEAVMNAARFHGMELDPRDFALIHGEQVPSAAALSAWLQNAGMWARAVRLRWRQLMRFQDAGPVVLLFNDGGAGLLIRVNAEHNVVILKGPRTAASECGVAVDKLRLEQVWSGEAVLLRAARGQPEADRPFGLSWLAGLVLQERRSLRDVGLASLTLSFLTIFPPLLVMNVVDKVLTHNSYSTLALLAALLAIAAVFEVLLGYARRLIVVVVGTRLDAKLNLHVFNRVLGPRIPHRQAAEHVPRFDDARRTAAIPVLSQYVPGLDGSGLRCVDHAGHPFLSAAAAARVHQGGSLRDREGIGARRDRFRHQDDKITCPGAAAQGAVGRARRRCRYVAPCFRQADELATDDRRPDRAFHVCRYRAGGRLHGAGG